MSCCCRFCFFFCCCWFVLQSACVMLNPLSPWALQKGEHYHIDDGYLLPCWTLQKGEHYLYSY